MSKENLNREETAERLSRFGRNINILGAVAIGGAALAVPGPNVLLATWSVVNAAQAGGFEWARRSAEKKRKKKRSGK